MRIIFVSATFVLLLVSASVLSAKQDRSFELSTVIEYGQAAIFLAQSDDDSNGRRSCGRRDKPPLSS